MVDGDLDWQVDTAEVVLGDQLDVLGGLDAGLGSDVQALA